jgi:hypothetical protein
VYLFNFKMWWDFLVVLCVYLGDVLHSFLVDKQMVSNMPILIFASLFFRSFTEWDLFDVFAILYLGASGWISTWNFSWPTSAVFFWCRQHHVVSSSFSWMYFYFHNVVAKADKISWITNGWWKNTISDTLVVLQMAPRLKLKPQIGHVYAQLIR